MLGHELTAMHGSDHAQTLAVVLPALWNENVTLNAPNCSSTPNACGTSPTVPTMRVSMPRLKPPVTSLKARACQRVSGYGSDGSSIPALLAKLEAHGMTQIGEHGDITLDVSRRIYEAAR